MASKCLQCLMVLCVVPGDPVEYNMTLLSNLDIHKDRKPVGRVADYSLRQLAAH